MLLKEIIIMPENFFGLLSFVLITTYTPGPATISSASMGIVYGYKGTFRYLLGLVLGNFLIMSLIGLVSTALLRSFPALEPILHYFGAAYIFYLAYGILKASYTFNEEDTKPLGMTHGLMLQLLNPKLFIYAFTLFSTYLAPITNNIAAVFLAAMLIALNSFGSTSVWALFGTAIRDYLHSTRIKMTVKIIFAFFLLYTGLQLII